MYRRELLFDIRIDALRMPEAVARVYELIARKSGSCAFVVTPNVDHIVMLQEREDLAAAYRDASLVLADGWPLVSASHWLGKPLPERVAGSDLVPALLESANIAQPLKLFLLGAAEGVGARAAARIHAQFPHATVTGVYSPPLGFEKDDAENAKILQMIADADADILVLGLGAPKQELWIHKHRGGVKAPVALCVGATIDFLAGEKRRAPVWVQMLRMEWLYRLAGEPRRLVSRYAKDARIFPQVVFREWRRNVFGAPRKRFV